MWPPATRFGAGPSARRVGLSVTGKRMGRSMESACQRWRQVERRVTAEPTCPAKPWRRGKARRKLDTTEAASFFAKATQDKSRLTRQPACANAWRGAGAAWKARERRDNWSGAGGRGSNRRDSFAGAAVAGRTTPTTPGRGHIPRAALAASVPKGSRKTTIRTTMTRRPHYRLTRCCFSNQVRISVRSLDHFSSLIANCLSK